MVSLETAQFPGFTRSREGSISEVQTGYHTWNLLDCIWDNEEGKREIGGGTNAFDGVAALDGELIEFLSGSDAGLRCEGVQRLPIRRAQMKAFCDGEDVSRSQSKKPDHQYGRRVHLSFLEVIAITWGCIYTSTGTRRSLILLASGISI
jgi:hypothetical protein